MLRSAPIRDLVFMPQRILILGRTGMLGHMVEHVLAADARFEIRAPSREEFDVLRGKTPEVEEEPKATGKPPVLRSAELERFLKDADYAINCIGITSRHIRDDDPASIARAVAVNAAFPHALAGAAAQQGVRVIHMSTDGVFSGNRSEPYSETDTPDAADTYGRTKILGESRAPNALNIRCSIMGPSPFKREGLWEWVASQPDGAVVDGHTNHIWHGVTTKQFAEFCGRIIAEDRFDALRSGGHILHFAPNAPMMKAELVAAIAAALGKRITVRPTASVPPVHRVLAVRPDIADVRSAQQPFTEVLRSCA